MADQLLYEQSNEPQGMSEPFISRQTVYIIDQNNGNYSGQIQIDTSSLSNSGKYASYSEAYLQVPLVIVHSANTGTAGFNTALTASDAPFAVGLKNGFHQLIHSMSVEYNNTNVIQLTPYTNFDVSYRLMTTMDEVDVRKNGPGIGFYPDSTDSFGWQAAASTSGVGVTNNSNYVPVQTVANSYATYKGTVGNRGLFERQKYISKQFGLTAGADTMSQFMIQSDAQSVGDNTYVRDTVNFSHVWNVMATIRLKDMHDFFDKMPLVKGAYLRFIINVNTATHTIRHTVAAGPTDVLSQSSATQASYGSSPLLLASGAANNGYNPIIAAVIAANPGAGTYDTQLTIGIGKATAANGTVYTHPSWGAQTRLYVPLYTMNPVQEEQYLSLNRTKKIVYNDIYQYQTNVDATGSFNALLTNGIPNPKQIVVIPMLQASANPITVATAPYLSPFATEPATTSPLVALKNFNIQLAGVNMFVQNEDYDFEQFKNQLSRQNAINGNLVDGLTSGLISENDFQTLYRYYVCDVSRRLPAEDAVPKSVQILGVSKCQKAISLFTFIHFERSIEIDLQTGQKIA